MNKIILEKIDKKILPHGWTWIHLDKISEKIVDGTHFTPRYVNAGIPFISVKDIKENKISFDNCRYISGDEHKKLSLRCNPEFNDVLITKSGTIGRTAVVKSTNSFSLFVSVALIKPLKVYVDSYFLASALEHYINSIDIQQDVKGGVIKNLHIEDLRLIPIPLASLNEQKRIVTKLEELFSEINNIKQLLEKTKILLKQHRQSLLKSAFEGKLTEKWREENNIGMNSEKKSLENLILFSKNGFTGKPNAAKKGIPRLGIETITRTNSIHVDETKHKFIEIPTSEIEVYRAKKGDLFVCRQNGNKNYVGKSAVFNDLIKPMIFSDSLIQLRPKTELIVPEYLAFFINSQQGRKQIEKFCSTTAGNYSINGTNLKKTIIAFPSLLEQKQIIVKIEEGLSLIENDEKIIDASLRNMDTMRKSILKQAFEGKLVPQDPNDEPASILLEKIQQDREKISQNQTIIKTRQFKSKRTKNAK